MATFRVCVFCGAHAGRSAEYVSIGRSLGTELGRRGIGLVYGAGGVGVMGAVSDGALALGLQHKPLAVLNVGGYYTPLAELLSHAVVEGFLSVADRSLVRLVDSIDDLWLVLVDAGWQRG